MSLLAPSDRALREPNLWTASRSHRSRGRSAGARIEQRIVNEIRHCRVKMAGVTTSLTASVGIATPRSGKSPSFARLIRDAHAALKAAQLKGGNRAIIR